MQNKPWDVRIVDINMEKNKALGKLICKLNKNTNKPKKTEADFLVEASADPQNELLLYHNYYDQEFMSDTIEENSHFEDLTNIPINSMHFYTSLYILFQFRSKLLNGKDKYNLHDPGVYTFTNFLAFCEDIT